MSINEKAREKYMGEIFYNNHGESCEIIEYINQRKILVKYDNGFIKEHDINALKSKQFINPYSKTLCGVGFYGEGVFKANGSEEHIHWREMIKRCYLPKKLSKQSTYQGCTVCEEWLNFQNFSEWYAKNKWDNAFTYLDKDILVKGNKIYSPETCILVNNEINTLFIKSDKARGKLPIGVIYQKNNHNYVARCSIYGKGMKHIGVFDNPNDAFYAYKEFKENHIKQIADKHKYKYTNFPIELYNAMYNYQVEITD